VLGLYVPGKKKKNYGPIRKDIVALYRNMIERIVEVYNNPQILVFADWNENLRNKEMQLDRLLIIYDNAEDAFTFEQKGARNKIVHSYIDYFFPTHLQDVKSF